MIFKSKVPIQIKFPFLIINKSPFVSRVDLNKLYSPKNIKSQKVFKFSKDKNEMKELTDRIKYFDNLNKIISLKEKITTEDMLAYTAKSKSTEKERNQNLKTSGNVRNLHPIATEHMDNKRSLIKELKILLRENQNLQENKFWGVSSAENEKEQIIRVSLIKDIFSSQFSFSNQLLDETFYEMKYEDSQTAKEKQEEEDLISKQDAAEAEIRNILEDRINRELKDVNMYNLKVPVKIPTKTLLRSSPARVPLPGLLQENDMNVDYGLDLEYERIIQLQNPSDDFGKKIKEDEDGKEKENEEQIDPSEISSKELLNQIDVTERQSIQPIISNLVK